MSYRHSLALAVLLAAGPASAQGLPPAPHMTGPVHARAQTPGDQLFPVFDTGAFCAGRPDGQVVGKARQSPCVTIESGARPGAEADWATASARDQTICQREAIEKAHIADAEIEARESEEPRAASPATAKADGTTPGSYITLMSCLAAHRRMEQAGLL
ncbi:hypothetical protein [Marinivivus vitaminiproducens]|uniref:hypothetical protein n=1 Tax=Marinivivus vitaminiproducens TaxID=3035935 RepID=UPI00279DE20B|nr:hypothetical protein P4R82_09475 [Geminicoccaceae bacterium SCSIO 64248]